MKLNDILFEQDLFDQYKDKVSDAVEANEAIQLWRGAANRGPVRLVDPTAFSAPRKSQFGPNTLLAWASNDPTWKDYPSRDRSVFMTNDYDYAAEAFGNGMVYQVLPFNSALLAVCPSSDFNDAESFPVIHQYAQNSNYSEYPADYIHTFFTWLARASGMRDVNFNALQSHDAYNECVKLLRGLKTLPPDALNKLKGEFDIVEDLVRSNDPYRTFAQLLAPDRNGFGLVRTRWMDKIDYNTSHEVWTNSPCLLVDIDVVDLPA